LSFKINRNETFFGFFEFSQEKRAINFGLLCQVISFVQCVLPLENKFDQKVVSTFLLKCLLPKEISNEQGAKKFTL